MATPVAEDDEWNYHNCLSCHRRVPMDENPPGLICRHCDNGFLQFEAPTPSSLDPQSEDDDLMGSEFNGSDEENDDDEESDDIELIRRSRELRNMIQWPWNNRLTSNNPQTDFVADHDLGGVLNRLAEVDIGRNGAQPAAKSVISGLPTVKILTEADAAYCTICQDIVGVGELMKKLPCGHGYHGDCIVEWLGVRNSCPVCRFELPTADVEYEEMREN